MQRIVRHDPPSLLLAFLSLIAAAILPMGSVANAATACPPGGEYYDCFLAISAPESVAIGQPFTVKVALMQYGFEGPASDSPVPKSDPCSKVMVTLELFYDGEGPWSNPTYSAKASGGIATFSVTVPVGSDPGKFYYWRASVDSEGPCGFDEGYFPPDTDFTAVALPPGQPIFPCPNDVSCDQVTNNDAGGGSAATLFANEGSFIDPHFEPLASGQGCATPPTDPINGVLTWTYAGPSEKTIVFALSSALVTKGIGQFNICFQATPASANNFDPPWQYLPKCSKSKTAPCVLFQTSGQHNVAYLGILVPPGEGDPKAYP